MIISFADNFHGTVSKKILETQEEDSRILQCVL